MSTPEKPNQIKVDLKRIDVAELVKIDEMLGAAAFFGAIGGESTRQLLSGAQARRFPKGLPIYKQGAAGNSLFLVLRGEVGLQRGEGDKAVEIATARKGDFFGEGEAMGDSTVRGYSATSLDADVVEVSFVDIEKLRKKHFQLHGLLREVRDARAKTNDELNDFLNRW